MFKHLLHYGSSKMLVAGAQLVILPFAFRLMGSAEYGAASLITQVALLLRQLQVQHVAQVVSREMPGSLKGCPTDSLRQAALWVISAVAAVSATILAVTGPEIAAATGLSVGQLWGGFGYSLVLSYSGLKLAFQVAANRISFVSFWEGLTGISVVLASVLAVYVLPKAWVFVAAGALATAAIASAFPWETGQVKDGSISAKGCMRLMYRPLLQYGAPVTIAAALTWVISVIDRFQIAGLLGLHRAGSYAAAYQILVAPANLLAAATTTVLEPALFRATDANSRRRARQFVALIVIGCAAYGISVAVVGTPLCARVLGNSFELGTGTIELFGLIAFLAAMVQVRISFLKSERRMLKVLAASGVCAVGVVMGNLLMIPKFGVGGAAFSSVLANLFMLGALTRGWSRLAPKA